MTMNAKAVYALYSNAVKTVADKAFDINDNEIELNMTNINNWVDPNAYVDKRVAEYPSMADQLDDIYHNGLDAWKLTIKAVKDKYPKE
jgi:cell division septal protein FtsQ